MLTLWPGVVRNVINWPAITDGDDTGAQLAHNLKLEA